MADSTERRPGAIRAWKGSRVPLTWPRLVAVLVLFVVTILVATTCQKAQVRVSQNQAIATARKQVAFTPKRTQVRLVRQGLNSRPYWAVSLSVPTADGTRYRIITVVRIDANTGRVAAVTTERNTKETGLSPSPAESGP